MKCKICRVEAGLFGYGLVLNKYRVSYFICESCNYIFTEDPFWLKEAYEIPINCYDTGILERNINFSKKIAVLLQCYFDCNKKFLDYAGGYGILVRLMRDIGFDFYWYDPYAKNIFARGFEYKQDQKIELVTALECFEHFVNPIDDIKKILKISKNIIFSTEVLPKTTPKITDWWYYTPNFGQHISFYSIKSLSKIANYFNLNFYSDNKNLHIFTEKKIKPFIFRFLVKNYNRFGILKKIRRQLKSKTHSDMKFLEGSKKY